MRRRLSPIHWQPSFNSSPLLTFITFYLPLAYNITAQSTGYIYIYKTMSNSAGTNKQWPINKKRKYVICIINNIKTNIVLPASILITFLRKLHRRRISFGWGFNLLSSLVVMNEQKCLIYTTLHYHEKTYSQKTYGIYNL